MNDCELLELAAKAAGHRYDAVVGSALISGSGFVWNPLVDDGQALRLAVSIPGLNLQWIIAEAWQAHANEGARLAYVRRTIVRLAAEIGRGMK
jgi:hypothetical protein